MRLLLLLPGQPAPLTPHCPAFPRPLLPPPPLQMQAELRRLRELLDQQQGYKNFQRLEAEVRRSRFQLPSVHPSERASVR